MIRLEPQNRREKKRSEQNKGFKRERIGRERIGRIVKSFREGRVQSCIYHVEYKVNYGIYRSLSLGRK